MIDKLQAIKDRWLNIQEELNDPMVANNQRRYAQLNRDYKELQKVVEAYEEYKLLVSNIENNRQILNTEKDADFRDLAKTELEQQEDVKLKLEDAIRQLLIPKDPEDERNAVLEIRAGTGGDEASLFAGDLYRMYVRYCESKRWKVAVISESEGTKGGYKEVILGCTTIRSSCQAMVGGLNC
jgi:peptide chain release factor 1